MMTDKLKNIISNILGLIMICFSVYALIYTDLEILEFSLLVAIGLSLFLFKVEKTKEWLSKILTKKID